MSGDHTPLDEGDPRNPRKVERSVALPYVPESVSGARRGLCADLRSLELGESRVDDAALILSELVSNALRHAGPLPDDTVGVSWRLEVHRDTSGGRLEIAVRDGGSTTLPRVARPSISGLGGRGLGIVQSLAGRWGTEMDATTTTVWAILDIAADDLPSDVDGAVTEPSVPLWQERPPAHDEEDVVEVDLGVGSEAPAWGALR
ncbi:ATP-binding protein [Nocardiopsis sp. MG754419]|uniref:ATP-binding protein n=1 Tax=Nocardiopsis sp. MG754419 TaxID=2259865 RepID=UPI001BA87E82|nr:ATP-binding protein [Nocardiopsis sp. MG754419]MBR8742254.1 ATP-binding protein [Nocardiopsis sp. MG754419]